MRRDESPHTASRLLSVAALLAVVGVAGCAGSGSVRRLEGDSRTHEMRLAELTQATAELQKELAAMRGQLDAVRRELAEVRQADEARDREAAEAVSKRFASTEKRLEALAGAVRGVEMSVGGLSDQVAKLEAVSTTAAAAPRREPRPKPTARAGTPALGPEELFARGMDGFKNGELAQAILDFEDFIARHGSHPLAGTAQFLIGEAYYNARDFQHATVEYRKAIDMAPKGERTPEALLKLGLAYRALKRPERAREVWTQLLQDFPQSDAAGKARGAMREASRAGKTGPAPDTGR
jgi:tol-pal system protein YbgF